MGLLPRKKMIVLLLLISQHTAGVEVEVEQGMESVLLPCQVSADVSSTPTSAVWNHVGLKNPTVHLRLQSGDYLKDQNDRYLSRTSMRVDALQTRDLSLTLWNPTVSDSGTYTCTTLSFGDMLSQTDVQLKVTEPPLPPPPPPVWPTVLSAVLVTLIILPAAFGLFVCRAYKRMKDREESLPLIVPVPQGQESVKLPFKTTADLQQVDRVEWRRSDSNSMMVHMYESGNNQPDKQDQGYRGRTEMDEDPLRTGDFSLTLKPLHLTDSGVYTCKVYMDNGHTLLQKVVTLSVRVPPPEVVNATHREESVKLPFKTAADLPQDVTVQWTDYKNMKVHVYESGKHQLLKQEQYYRGRTEMKKDPLTTKDLSLTLKHPQLTDSGVYTCKVYMDNGHTLLHKSVALHVIDKEPKRIVTVSGEKSLMLQFEKADKPPNICTVEWKLIYPKYKSIKTISNRQGNEEDLSVNLTDLCYSDSGVYTCTAYDKDEHALLQTSVILSVRDIQVEVAEVTEGQESVLLPFKATADLPLNVTVQWTDYNNLKVHVYESGNNQPDKQDQSYSGRTEMKEDPLTTKDLSLTLKHPQLTDSGVYTCTVYNNDARVLLEKLVTLRVRATLVGTMEDMFPCLRRRASKPEVKEDVRDMNHEDVPLTAEETV